MEMTANFRSFASDNNAGASPEVMEALLAANRGHAIGYGDDPWTERACALFKKEFGPDSETFFVLNGTGANVLALSLATGAGQSVLSAEDAHIAVDEAGAPEAAGLKVLPLRSVKGKLQPEALHEALRVLGSVHQAQPSCLSLSEATELGTLYATEEIRDLAKIAHEAGLYVHLDGARIANAAAALDRSFRELVTETGVDLLSFGGMKNGVAFGEALVVLNPALARRAPFLRKTRLQLDSKMRFIAAQYEAYLADGLWLKNARAANAAAKRLAALIRDIPELRLAHEPETNALFVRLPVPAAEALRKEYFFYDWEGGLVRWMTSFDTTEEDLIGFVAALGRALGRA